MLHGKLSRCFANRNFLWRSRCRRRRGTLAPPRPQTNPDTFDPGGEGGGVLRISSDSDDFLILAIIFWG